MSDPIQHWQQLCEQSRRERTPQEPDEQAPLGFAARVVAQWRELQANQRFRFWQRWSLRAALVALLLCGISMALQRNALAKSLNAEAPGIVPPTLPLPPASMP
jgi:hypothetical protein